MSLTVCNCIFCILLPDLFLLPVRLQLLNVEEDIFRTDFGFLAITSVYVQLYLTRQTLRPHIK
jgi:hypothetical protein